MTIQPGDDSANERPDASEEPQDTLAADEATTEAAEDAAGMPHDGATEAAEPAAEQTEAAGTGRDTPIGASTPYGDTTAPAGGTVPPPRAGGYASQFGLVRPLQGRYIAGVCAALGRATNTDPVLWRVVLPVLTVVGGLGILLYIVGWLLIPAEGDSASPFEALIGRGRSSTSKLWTIVLSIVALSALIGGFTRGPGSRFLLLAAVIGGIALLVTSRDPRSGWRRPDPTRPSWTRPPTSQPWPGQPDPDAMYQPPFAPHGPFAPSSTFSTTPTTPYTTAVINPMDVEAPLAAPPVFVPPPKPTKARRAILSSVILAVGLLGALDAANVVSIPVAMYFAVALGVLGAGLIVASFFGRVRGPITLGVFLVIGLLISSIVGGLHGSYGSDNVYQPRTFANLSHDYTDSVGRTTLDLTKLDFATQPEPYNISIRLNVGLIRVILPPDVDVTVTGHVDVGATEILDHHQGGIGNNPVSYTDQGNDGAGGGTVVLDTNVNVGKVEVTR